MDRWKNRNSKVEELFLGYTEGFPNMVLLVIALVIVFFATLMLGAIISVLIAWAL